MGQFSRSVVSDSVIPCTTACQASLSITNSWSLPKLMSIESVIPSNHLILCHPLLLLPSIFPSIRVFSNESALRIRWPKYWSFSFSISPSSEHPGLISFRIWDSHYPNYPVLRICNVSIWWAANLNQRKKNIWYSCHLQQFPTLGTGDLLMTTIFPSDTAQNSSQLHYPGKLCPADILENSPEMKTFWPSRAKWSFLQF